MYFHIKLDPSAVSEKAHQHVIGYSVPWSCCNWKIMWSDLLETKLCQNMTAT